MIEFISSLGVGGSIATLALVAAIALYGVRFAKILSSASTVVLVLLGVLVVGTLLGWLELSVIVSDVSSGIRAALELVVDVVASSSSMG